MDPSAVSGAGAVSAKLELLSIAGPAMKDTDPSDLETGVKSERIFVSAFLEVMPQVEVPLEVLDEQAE